MESDKKLSNGRGFLNEKGKEKERLAGSKGLCHSVYLKQNYKMLKSLPQDEGGCVVVAVAAEHWVKVGQRKPEKHKVDQDGGTDFVFSFFFLSSSVQPRLKLLQLWTAHQSANRIFCLNRISPPCCEGGAGAVPALW